jgi:hypothetical protein
MTPGDAKSDDKYTISKQLLFAYLASPGVLDACDGQQYIMDQVSYCSKTMLSYTIKRFFSSERSICIIATLKPQAPMKAPALESRNMPPPSSPATYGFIKTKIII